METQRPRERNYRIQRYSYSEAQTGEIDTIDRYKSEDRNLGHKWILARK